MQLYEWSMKFRFTLLNYFKKFIFYLFELKVIKMQMN